MPREICFATGTILIIFVTTYYCSYQIIKFAGYYSSRHTNCTSVKTTIREIDSTVTSTPKQQTFHNAKLQFVRTRYDCTVQKLITDVLRFVKRARKHLPCENGVREDEITDLNSLLKNCASIKNVAIANRPNIIMHPHAFHQLLKAVIQL